MAQNIYANSYNGWISTHRSLSQHPIWLSEVFTRGQAWLDLLLLANHTNGYFRHTRGQRINVLRGQVGYSMKTLANRWKWSDGKVKRFLNELESDDMVTLHKNNVTTIITITNYEHFQSSDVQTTHKGVADESQTRTNNNENKKNNKNNDNKKRFSPPSLKELSSYFNEKNSTPVEAEKFMDYYSANGWKVGKNTMNDWKAAVRNWIKRSDEYQQNKSFNNNSKNTLDNESDFEYIPAK